MATYNVTGVGGTTGHPSNGRTPYLVENTIDVSAVNGDSGAAQNDVLQCIDVPAETLIMAAGVEVLTACSSSVVIDIGVTEVQQDFLILMLSLMLMMQQVQLMHLEMLQMQDRCLQSKQQTLSML